MYSVEPSPSPLHHLSLYLYIYMCIYVYIRIYVDICTYVFLYIYVYTYLSSYLYIYMCIYVYIRIYVDVHICTYIFILIHIYIYICIHMNMYIISPCIPFNPKSLVLTANCTISSHVSTDDKLIEWLISFLKILDLGLTYVEYWLAFYVLHVRRVLFTIKLLHKCLELLCWLFMPYRLGLCVLSRTYRQDYEKPFHGAILHHFQKISVYVYIQIQICAYIHIQMHI
jgi:hypothetical protein